MNKIYKDFDPDKHYRFHLNKVKLKMMPFVVYTAMITMFFSVVAGFVVLVLAGLAVLTLPEKVLVIFASSTVGAVGTVMVIFYRFFLGKK